MRLIAIVLVTTTVATAAALGLYAATGTLPSGSQAQAAGVQDGADPRQATLDALRRERRISGLEFFHMQLVNAYRDEDGHVEFPPRLEDVIEKLGDDFDIRGDLTGDVVYYGPASWDGNSPSDRILFHTRSTTKGERFIVFVDRRVEVATVPERVEPPQHPR